MVGKRSSYSFTSERKPSMLVLVASAQMQRKRDRKDQCGGTLSHAITQTRWQDKQLHAHVLAMAGPCEGKVVENRQDRQTREDEVMWRLM